MKISKVKAKSTVIAKATASRTCGINAEIWNFHRKIGLINLSFWYKLRKKDGRKMNESLLVDTFENGVVVFGYPII